MKKLIISAAFLTLSGIAFAQQDGQADQDRIQQEPPRPAQRELERSANKTNATKKQSEKEIEAEMRAKQKGQEHNSKIQPNSGIPPKLNDTLNPPLKKPVNPQP